MTPVQSIRTCLRKYVAFSGRASTSEFWWFWVAKAAILLVFGSLNTFVGLCIAILLFLPTLSAAYRRLADTGVKPWLVLPIAAGLIALQFVTPELGMASGSLSAAAWTLMLGYLALNLAAFALLIRQSQPGTNQYGPNPTEVAP